jgi:hypothetical protein
MVYDMVNLPISLIHNVTGFGHLFLSSSAIASLISDERGGDNHIHSFEQETVAFFVQVL